MTDRYIREALERQRRRHELISYLLIVFAVMVGVAIGIAIALWQAG